MRYSITRDFIRTGNSRSGQKMDKVRFIVSHSTGNPGSTAYGNRNYFDRSQPSSSAHTFIDDQYILEIIPLSEKAWHVQYNKTADNRLFGDDANDAAIGVELCYGGRISFRQAYDRYVWYHAYLCDAFSLNPTEDIVAHTTLDPSRRSDPLDVFRQNGLTWSVFIDDVREVLANEFKGNSGTPADRSDTGHAAPSLVKGVSIRLPLRNGDKGTFVKELQQDLIRAGFSLPRYGADGMYGDETQNAVMRFQKQYGLQVDGLAGTNTLNRLDEVNRQRKAPSDFPLPEGILKKGDRGENVKMLQRALKHLNFDPKQIDGIYGNNTENAVRRFQSMFAALKADGIYGPQTRKFMRMELDD